MYTTHTQYTQACTRIQNTYMARTITTKHTQRTLEHTSARTVCTQLVSAHMHTRHTHAHSDIFITYLFSTLTHINKHDTYTTLTHTRTYTTYIGNIFGVQTM